MNKRLPFVSFIAASALLFTGCASTVSKEEAEKFVEENYTSTEKKQATVHAIMDISKSEGIFESFFKVGKTEEDTKDNVSPITKLDLAGYAELGDFFKFKTQGKKFIVEYDVKDMKDVMKMAGQEGNLPEGAEFDGRASGKTVFNENGYPESDEASVNLSFEYSSSGITMKGALKMTSKVTYTY